MKDSLGPGITGTATHLVTDDMSPPHLPVNVLSTPNMVLMIENLCATTVQEHLDEGETTVGIHVCVSHSAAANAGDDVEIACEVTERDRRRLVFETTVTSGEKTVSEGTHQRFVVSFDQTA